MIAASTKTDPLADVDIIIVGAGFSGIGMGVRLKEQRTDSFVILERADSLGGSWRDNTYPGVACDVPSPLYSFSFQTNPEWSRLFAPGQEIWQYLQKVADDATLGEHLRFGAEMSSAVWDGDSERWVVTTTAGTFTGRYLISAMGHLTDPKLPDIPGIGEFSGTVMHSARWNPDVDLDGKRVGVVGTGASAIQVVPSIASKVEHLVLFQRTAPYIVARQDFEFTEVQKKQFRRDPDAISELRQSIFWLGEYSFAARRLVPAYLEEARREALSHMQSQIEDPLLRDLLTPDYEIGCKRILRSDDFYPTLTRDNVTLEPSALARVDSGRAVSSAGRGFDLDVLILATGFETWDLPSSYLIHGRNGETLAEHWSSGMQAYNSTTVHGFPNLFLLNGPATSLGHNSLIFMIEAQIDYVLGALRWADASRRAIVEVEESAEGRYADLLHAQAQETALLRGGCDSWYLDPRNGKATLSWPNFAHSFRDQCATFDPAPYADQAVELGA
ncbi:NAD(P)-binding domain-containing protein [Gordonia sp. SID5947]|uniref:flavin-containing monooxygenase n=1 Tax=Gordonia sp. SID5947 TaxID=2690315 RepID=UPI00136D2710|nr:NAD(P)/FAD-dependent oxidoreductase [Gordonia sp. SID5947]MYR07940.1 NAD(P)-binding domain-containing protein [Gordonia sp. SID5947]